MEASAGKYGDALTPEEVYLDGHCWIVSEDGATILDLTADQFGGNRIYFGPVTGKYLKVYDELSDPYDTGFYEPARAAYIARLAKQNTKE